ncbi:hypothetical protein B0H16DRAFT_1485781 [Mycena metata]|uniref:Uncharacterized protein n=1 Tax=Mycena metata TaxID=1033252 RepID=A0AAD7DMX4_9AGAR|nr:hypothetical protein B0H16DRAFT_1485781 [Mycena metata]
MEQLLNMQNQILGVDGHNNWNERCRPTSAVFLCKHADSNPETQLGHSVAVGGPHHNAGSPAHLIGHFSVHEPTSQTYIGRSLCRSLAGLDPEEVPPGSTSSHGRHQPHNHPEREGLVYEKRHPLLESVRHHRLPPTPTHLHAHYRRAITPALHHGPVNYVSNYTVLPPALVPLPRFRDLPVVDHYAGPESSVRSVYLAVCVECHAHSCRARPRFMYAASKFVIARARFPSTNGARYSLHVEIDAGRSLNANTPHLKPNTPHQSPYDYNTKTSASSYALAMIYGLNYPNKHFNL